VGGWRGGGLDLDSFWISWGFGGLLECGVSLNSQLVRLSSTLTPTLLTYRSTTNRMIGSSSRQSRTTTSSSTTGELNPVHAAAAPSKTLFCTRQPPLPPPPTSGNNDAWRGYGGAVVYTRARSLPPEIIPELQEAAAKVGLEWSRFTATDNTCGPHPPAQSLLQVRARARLGGRWRGRLRCFAVGLGSLGVGSVWGPFPTNHHHHLLLNLLHHQTPAGG